MPTVPVLAHRASVLSPDVADYAARRTLRPRRRRRPEVRSIVRDSSATIATELHLSISTIKSRVSSILTQLALANRVQIALMVQNTQ